MRDEKIDSHRDIKSKNLSKRTGVVYLLALIFSVLPFRVTWAEDLLKGGEYSFDASIGYNYANVDGYRGKVGEYEYLHSSVEGSFDFQGNAQRQYLDLWGNYKNKNDQQYLFDLDVSRIFQSETTYSRFIHYLDNDPLTNQDFYTDFEQGTNHSIIVQNIKSENTFRIPFIPNLKLNADFRQLNRRGHKQTTTVSHCTECHVTSKGKRVNQTTEYADLGAELTIKGVTFNYDYKQKSFHDSGDAPVAYYSSEGGDFPIRGFQEYSRVPDSKTSVNRFRGNAALPFRSSLHFDYQVGETRNRDTDYERDFTSTAVQFSTASLKYVTFNFNYHDLDVDNNVPDAMEKDITRRSVSFKTKPWKKNYLRGSYRWEDIDRRNASPRTTRREYYWVSFLNRAYRKIDFTARYTHERTDDPFLNEEWGLFRSEKTSVPTRTDTVRAAVNWNLRGNCSLSSTILYEGAQSNRYDIDEDRLEMIFSIWFAPRENLIITGYYSYIDAKIDALTEYKTYHGWWQSDFSFDDKTSYDATTNCFNLMLNYRFHRNIALTSNVIYADSRSDFDADVYRVNVGDYSKLRIERISFALGLDYFYTPQLSFYTKYNYRDYNDKEVNSLDGQLNYFSVGMNYTF